MKTYRIILLSVLFSFVASVALAQDLIVKRDAEEIEAKVEEITDTHIKYHKFSNLEGPVYSVAKSEVLMIKYANGEKDVFTAEQPKPSTQVSQTEPAEPIYEGGIMTQRGGRFYVNGERVKGAVALKYATPYPEVKFQIQKARDITIVGDVVGWIGTGTWFVGILTHTDYSLGFGQSMAKAFLNPVSLTGLGLTLVGDLLPRVFAVAPAKKAAAMYNEAVNGEYAHSYLRLSLAPTMGGLGLQLTF
jgi:hypothetical protein